MLTLCNDLLKDIVLRLNDGKSLYALSSTCTLLRQLLEEEEIYTKVREAIIQCKQNTPLHEEIVNGEELGFVTWYEKNYYTRKCLASLHRREAIIKAIINFDFEYVLDNMLFLGRGAIQSFCSLLPSFQLNEWELMRLAEFAVSVYGWFATNYKGGISRKNEGLLVKETYTLCLQLGLEEEFLKRFPIQSQELVAATLNSFNSTVNSWKRLVDVFGEENILLKLRIELSSCNAKMTPVPKQLPNYIPIIDCFGARVCAQIRKHIRIYEKYFYKCLSMKGRVRWNYPVETGEKQKSEREKYALMLAEIHTRLESYK